MITPLDYIKNHVNVKLSPSKIHGVGLFTLRNIYKGEDLFVNWNGDSGKYQITQEDLDQLEPSVKEHVYDMFQFSKTNGSWELNIYLEENCHWIFKTPSHWVNSCSWNEFPNVDLKLNKTLTYISAGTELLTRYGKYKKHANLRTI